jgi:hypothetical protein
MALMLVQSSLRFIESACFRVITAVIIKFSSLLRYDTVNIGICYQSLVETLCLHLQECQIAALKMETVFISTPLDSISKVAHNYPPEGCNRL